MKVGDMVTVKKSSTNGFSSWWFSLCAEHQTPLLVIGHGYPGDYESGNLRLDLFHPEEGVVHIDENHLSLRSVA